MSAHRVPLRPCAGRRETCISERLIKTMADAMHEEGFVDAGYTYIQVDDCWAASKRNAAGAIVPDPVRFPSGMKALADYVHAKGMKLGLCEPCATDTLALCAPDPHRRGLRRRHRRLDVRWFHRLQRQRGAGPRGGR